MTGEQFARAISETESHRNPRAYGDGGRALTSFQCHAAWLLQWAAALLLNPLVSETWESFVGRVVAAFFEHHFGWAPVDLAMYYHRGHAVRRTDNDWDSAYEDRFYVAVTTDDL